MKQKNIRNLNKELKTIKEAFTEEKKRYSANNKAIIKKESKELFDLFLSEEKKWLQFMKIKYKKKR